MTYIHGDTCFWGHVAAAQQDDSVQWRLFQSHTLHGEPITVCTGWGICDIPRDFHLRERGREQLEVSAVPRRQVGINGASYYNHTVSLVWFPA